MYKSVVESPETTALFEAVLSLSSVEECYRFFDDICTVSEIKAITQRLEVVKMLHKKETFSVIAEKTGASTATISRVNRCLQYGSGGYKMILERLGEKQP